MQVEFDEQLIGSAHKLAELMRETNKDLYITGLAASGKTSVAELVSQISGIPLLDSGLPFRLATYLIQCIPVLNQPDLAGRNLRLLDQVMSAHRLENVGNEQRIFSGDADITDLLRSPEVESGIPAVAADPKIRPLALKFLKQANDGPVIAAARGATEPISGGQIIQIGLFCELNERARRRAKQSREPIGRVKKSIRERDQRDLLGPAQYPSTETIDTTKLAIDVVVTEVIHRTLKRIVALQDGELAPRTTVDDKKLRQNPIMEAVSEKIRNLVEELEKSDGVPSGMTLPRLLLHCSRLSPEYVFENWNRDKLLWIAGDYPEYFNLPGEVKFNPSVLEDEALIRVRESKRRYETFIESTKLPPQMFEPVADEAIVHHRNHFFTKCKDGKVSREFVIRDCSLECGKAIEENLHYLGIPREDSIVRLALVEKDTDYIVLYLSFGNNTRTYFEPMLWNLGYRMEEVAVAVRGYGTPRAPKNAMGLFLRETHKILHKRFPHLQACITDINPNWGFDASSFSEGGYMPIGLKYSEPSFIGSEYASRRKLDSSAGNRTATAAQLPIIPTFTMIRPKDKNGISKVEETVADGLYYVPRDLYERR